MKNKNLKKLILENYKKQSKVGILIPVRSDSKRLPGKHLKILNNRSKLTMLDYCIKRCKKSKIKDIILCTSYNKNDDIYETYAKKNKINIFRGSKNNVLKRFIDCSEKYNLTDIVRITGDCPLVDKNIINNLLKIYRRGDYDYVSNITPPTFPDGLDVEIVSLVALKKSFSENKTDENREHVTLHIRKNINYKKFNMINYIDLSKTKWSVDNITDLELIKKIINHFHPKIYFDWKKIYSFLNKTKE